MKLGCLIYSLGTLSRLATPRPLFSPVFRARRMIVRHNTTNVGSGRFRYASNRFTSGSRPTRHPDEPAANRKTRISIAIGRVNGATNKNRRNRIGLPAAISDKSTPRERGERVSDGWGWIYVVTILSYNNIVCLTTRFVLVPPYMHECIVRILQRRVLTRFVVYNFTLGIRIIPLLPPPRVV